MDKTKCRKVKMSDSLLAQLFNHGIPRMFEVFEDALPGDAVIIDAIKPVGTHYVEFTVFSEEFDSIPEGAELPVMVPHCRVITLREFYTNRNAQP